MFTDIESALVERLKTQLKETMPDVHVLTASELSDVEERNQPTPAVHVIYNGYRVKQNRPDGKVTVVSQTWLTVVAVRNVRQRGKGAAAREDAIPLCQKITEELMGYHPQVAASPVTLTNAPAQGSNNGFLYVPLAFAVDTVLKAAN
jgi:phage gp37-like protein